jgi:hypothetical protein
LTLTTTVYFPSRFPPHESFMKSCFFCNLGIQIKKIK